MILWKLESRQETLNIFKYFRSFYIFQGKKYLFALTIYSKVGTGFGSKLIRILTPDFNVE